MMLFSRTLICSAFLDRRFTNICRITITAVHAQHMSTAAVHSSDVDCSSCRRVGLSSRGQYAAVPLLTGASAAVKIFSSVLLREMLSSDRTSVSICVRAYI